MPHLLAQDPSHASRTPTPQLPRRPPALVLALPPRRTSASSAAPPPVVLRTRGGHISGGFTRSGGGFSPSEKGPRCRSRLFTVLPSVSLCPLGFRRSFAVHPVGGGRGRYRRASPGLQRPLGNRGHDDSAPPSPRRTGRGTGPRRPRRAFLHGAGTAGPGTRQRWGGLGLVGRAAPGRVSTWKLALLARGCE